MTSKGTLQNARDSVAAGEASAHAPARDAARALPLFESLKALIEEAGELACNAALDSGARFKRLCALDAYARAILDSALESSGRALGLSGYRRDPAVFLARDLYGSLLDGYHRCDSGRANDEADQRRKLQLMKAAAERTKWERFAGGPSYAGLWQWTGAVMQTTPELPPLSGAGPETGGEPAAEAMVRQEYLRTLAYFSASYEQLSPDLFGVVSRIVDLSLPWLQLDRLPAPGTLYYVDLEGGVGPVRFVHHPQPSHGVRFFSTARAHEQLTELRRALSKGQLPAGFDLMPVKRGALAAGIDHLLVHWSATPPVRRNRRHPVSGALDAVVGFDLVELVLTGQKAPGIRRWCFTDVSRGGVGMRADSGFSAEIVPGSLVAIRPCDGGVWHLGMAQRVWRSDGEGVQVGVQTLSAAPHVAIVDDGLNSTAVFLCDPIQRGEAVRVVMPLGVLRTDVSLDLDDGEGRCELRPLGAHVAGQDFDLRAYQVLHR